MSARAKSPAAATRPAPEARSAAAGPPERSERWGRGSAHGGLSQSGLTIGLGAASTVLGGLGLTLTSQIVFAVVGTAAAVVALVFANPVARYVVLGVAVAGPA